MGKEISRWWRYGVLLIITAGFAVLGWVSGTAYKVGPPMPEKVLGPDDEIVFTGNDVISGQQVFLKNALMENGSIWGHGAYLGPDFTAKYLHQLILDARNTLAMHDFGRSESQLEETEKASVKETANSLLRQNRYDAASGTLTFTGAEADSFRSQLVLWKEFFTDPNANRGLGSKNISDPEELRQLTAFFAWTAWAAAANIPGKSYSYTMNFPYDPAFGNGPSADTILWSALSLVALLAGTAAVLFAFGKFDYLGWYEERSHIHPQLLSGVTSDSQKATLKFFVVVSLLFLAQALIGGAIAHFRAQPGSFYGFNLADILPSNALRSWHLQLAILWIATAYVGGGLFMASALGGYEPKGQVKAINILFVALVVIVFGSLAGEYLGVKQLMGKLWFWFGNQGWEYLELGRGWQVLLAIGLVFWAILLVRGTGPARKDPQQKEITWLFLLAAFAIPIFYLPAFFFSSASRFTVVDTWRFWIIHLWVEGFFELFVTIIVAVMFFKLGMVSRKTATRVIYLDAVLFLGSGIIGTGHHWYWTGQSNISMALSATFSAMEVVPLILLTLDASDFTRLMRGKCDICDKEIIVPHRWTFYFLIAVGVWNFIGAGVFGFLINLPVVSYYEAGTNLTANHGHAALMGVFGMLAVALLVFALRELSTDVQWLHTKKYVAVSFWGLNIGLGLMVILSLFPSGVLQLFDVVNNGYWHARGPEFSSGRLVTLLEWLRMPADLIFIVIGVVPLVIASCLVYLQSGKLQEKLSA
jgi:nitric oxide reductase subunit B